MYEKIEVCPGCKHTLFSNFLICTDHSISGESFALSKCNKCELVFTNPRPTEDSLTKYYASDNYISHSNKSNNLINSIYKLVRNYTTSKKIQLIKKVAHGKQLLDYGCGTGFFLSKCKKEGYHTFGYEPNEDASKIAIGQDLTLLSSIKESDASFDIITAWHVIEHIISLRETLETLVNKLRTDGILIIAVPNLSSFDSNYYGEYWAALDVPRHLYHFTQTSFGKLVADLELKIQDVIPMYFDSYYVSLLSEKYKKTSGSIFNAIKTGYLSNKKAKQTGEYSSLIFILKK